MASAVTAALRWFAPPAGTVLHSESTETSGGQTIRREFWQSADDPDQQRFLVDAGAGHVYELGGPGKRLYDPQTNTIYDAGDAGSEADKAAQAAADETKAAQVAAGKTEAPRVAADKTKAAPSDTAPTAAEVAAKRAKAKAEPKPARPDVRRGTRGRVHGRRPDGREDPLRPPGGPRERHGERGAQRCRRVGDLAERERRPPGLDALG